MAAAWPGEPNDVTLQTLPTIPNYEALELLGQGGIGVVYKAWHQQLKRPVALKMLRAGAHASRATVLRFRFEAEAVASLAHPNIVQIHEVGEHEGLLYLALEFVDGGSLEDFALKKPLVPREVARLLEMLARAIAHANQRGVIHHDLKPTNVLMTRQHHRPVPLYQLGECRLVVLGVEALQQLAVGRIAALPLGGEPSDEAENRVRLSRGHMPGSPDRALPLLIYAAE